MQHLMAVMSGRNSFIRRSRGAALAEFAVMLVAVVPFIFGAVQLSRMVVVQQTVSQAAAMGARFAATRGDTEEVRQWVNAELDTIGLTASELTISAGAWCWGETVGVTVTVPFTLNIPFLGERGYMLGASSFARVERDIDPGCPSF